jgi:hypothetical protein
MWATILIFLSFAQRITHSVGKECSSHIQAGCYTDGVAVHNLCDEAVLRESSSVPRGSLAFLLPIDIEPA